MIDSEELLREICGVDKLPAFRDVKLTSMRLGRVVKEIIACDLGGTLPVKGKQFLTTWRGTWRLATRANSDNTTEEVAHRQMGAGLVQVFGELGEDRRGRGWITVEELYEVHRVKFDPDRLIKEVVGRLRRV
jgi:hypothetical protein